VLPPDSAILTREPGSAIMGNGGGFFAQEQGNGRRGSQPKSERRCKPYRLSRHGLYGRLAAVELTGILRYTGRST
jgi:hypothetical protein